MGRTHDHEAVPTAAVARTPAAPAASLTSFAAGMGNSAFGAVLARDPHGHHHHHHHLTAPPPSGVADMPPPSGVAPVGPGWSPPPSGVADMPPPSGVAPVGLPPAGHLPGTTGPGNPDFQQGHGHHRHHHHHGHPHAPAWPGPPIHLPHGAPPPSGVTPEGFAWLVRHGMAAPPSGVAGPTIFGPGVNAPPPSGVAP